MSTLQVQQRCFGGNSRRHHGQRIDTGGPGHLEDSEAGNRARVPQEVAGGDGGLVWRLHGAAGGRFRPTGMGYSMNLPLSRNLIHIVLQLSS